MSRRMMKVVTNLDRLCDCDGVKMEQIALRDWRHNILPNRDWRNKISSNNGRVGLYRAPVFLFYSKECNRIDHGLYYA